MQDAVLQQVDRDRIVELACNLASIVSITGEEEDVAKYLGSEFEKLGMQVEYQYVEDGRPNVVGTLKARRRRDADVQSAHGAFRQLPGDSG
jgi:acetylornithine deacetylase/succinyl-diaminopimelate desuccinylase-like protein